VYWFHQQEFRTDLLLLFYQKIHFFFFTQLSNISIPIVSLRVEVSLFVLSPEIEDRDKVEVAQKDLLL
jgi:hypothetical protein